MKARVGASMQRISAVWPLLKPYITAAGGTPLIRIGATDAVITHRIGKGWTIYLNTLFDKYPKLRAEKFGGANYRALVDALLDHAGVRPAIQVLSADGKRLTQAQVARYRFRRRGDSHRSLKTTSRSRGLSGETASPFTTTPL